MAFGIKNNGGLLWPTAAQPAVSNLPALPLLPWPPKGPQTPHSPAKDTLILQSKTGQTPNNAGPLPQWVNNTLNKQPLAGQLGLVGLAMQKTKALQTLHSPPISNANQRFWLNPATLVQATEPTIAPATPQEKILLQQLPPTLGQLLLNSLQPSTVASPETLEERLLMWLRLNRLLDPPHQGLLTQLLQPTANSPAGDFKAICQSDSPLADVRGDDRHSTLYHLYAIATTPRAPGLNPIITLKETLRFLANPNANQQNFTPLSAHNLMLMTALLNPSASGEKTSLNDNYQQQAFTPLQNLSAITLSNTNTCAASAQMSRLASQTPKEFTRQINQLTSPYAMFLEKATPYQLNPDVPQEARILLEQNNLVFDQLQSGDFLIQFPAPRLGLLRAINTQQQPPNPTVASGIETLYQTALLYNATRKSYNPATDQRDALDLAQVTIQNSPSLNNNQKTQLFNLFKQTPRADLLRQQVEATLAQTPNLSAEDLKAIDTALHTQSVGLTEMEKNLMERIIEDAEPLTSVTYQVNGAAPARNRANEGDIFLYGYTRTFDQMTEDLVRALQKGREIILGITFSANGRMVGGHELKVQDYFIDPQDGQLKFRVADSDDKIAGLSIIAASKLVPQIHHMGLPHELAKEIWASVLNNPSQYYTPDAQDARHYQIIDVLNTPPPVGTLLPGQLYAAQAQQNDDETPPSI